MENYRSGKKQFLKSIELNVTSNDICTLFNTQNINIEQNSVITLFGSVIEVLYFMKYLTILNNNIKNITEFKVTYNLFRNCELLKNEIVAKLKNTFKENEDVEALCSCIYYTIPGISQELIDNIPHSSEILDRLLDAELIKKNENDYFVCWHDYYRDIYISHFPLKPCGGLRIPFEDVYHLKLQLKLKTSDNNTINDLLAKIQRLFEDQKYYSIYYILENVFSTEYEQKHFKNSVGIQK